MTIIEINVTLSGIEPSVVRTIEVPLNIKLDRLHAVIQAAMGWTNSHLYMFQAGDATWGIVDPDFGGDDLPANKTTLQQLINDTGASSFSYVYDFGDDWHHQIKLGKIREGTSGALYPRLTNVQGACPPEDIGGAPGYYHFLEVISDTNHPEHEELTEWHGDDFDPNAPETDILTFEVTRLAKKWQPRKKS